MWIFGRAAIDLAVFGGTAAIALVLVLVGPSGGAAPEWTWIAGVLLVDVAHVWSTAFVVYLDPHERRRRPVAYLAIPLACAIAATALYAGGGPALFWRAIAYLAVFHFIRQQYGWVMLYRAKAGERDRLGRALDGATIYATMLYPLIAWHAHLPRAFHWMTGGDFVDGIVPPIAVPIAGAIYAALLASYIVRSIVVGARTGVWNWGKHVIVATTAATWYVGIVATNSDYAFTVTNVFVHGVPYLALVFVYARRAAADGSVSRAGLAARALANGRTWWRALALFLASLWVVAYVEELLWDRGLDHERAYLFGGGGWQLGAAATAILAGLLATPQLTHYLVDAILWRRSTNPRVARIL